VSDLLFGQIIRKPASGQIPWRALEVVAAEQMLGRGPTVSVVVATFIHMSDLHICDAASPVRLEFLDRIADPDNPLSTLAPYIGTYRAQEFLTTQVLEAMVDASNQIKVGPLTGAGVDAVLITGDITDNAQQNELNWYKQILDGGIVDPSSGQVGNCDASHASQPSAYDIHYYHPDGPPPGFPADRPHQLYGFPHFTGVVEGARAPFIAAGLKHPWFAIHGNHDALLQGTAAPTAELHNLIIGGEKLSALKDLSNLPELFAGFGGIGPAIYPGANQLVTRQVVADSRRGLISIPDWVATHSNCKHDHGLDSASPNTAYWYRDINQQVRVIALDTVNRFGGWQGCVHREQFDWLHDLLLASVDRYVIITSHHPLQCLINGYVPAGEVAPALASEIIQLLQNFPNIILWLAGHVHDHRITEIKNQDGSVAFWEIRTGSHIDWPQQSRTIEIVKTGEHKIAIGTVIFNHSGPINFTGTGDQSSNPIALAGLSRLLAANDWQRREGTPYALEQLAGDRADRNTWLWANDPFA
jgi:metallophosphoesterase (TIGR03767 family)